MHDWAHSHGRLQRSNHTHTTGYSCVVTHIFRHVHFHKRVQMWVRCGQDVMLCVSVSASVISHQHTCILQRSFQLQACGCLSLCLLCVCVFFFLNKVYLLVFDALPLEGNAKTWQQWRGDRVQTQPLCPDENQSVPAAVCEWHFGLLIHWPINLLCCHLVSLMFVYVRVCVCVWGPSCHIHALRWVLVYLNHGWNRQVYAPLVTKALGLGNRSLSSWVNNLVREYEWNEFGLIWG